MRQLMVMDEKNYTDDMPVYEKTAVRAVIKRYSFIAMQQGKNGAYKIPGGGVEQGESLHEALIREVEEETGLIVIPETIIDIGEIEEIREDIFCKGQKYISHSLFYYCAVKNELKAPTMTENELELGYHLVWVSPEEAFNNNARLLNESWRSRDLHFIKMLIDKTI